MLDRLQNNVCTFAHEIEYKNGCLPIYLDQKNISKPANNVSITNKNQALINLNKCLVSCVLQGPFTFPVYSINQSSLISYYKSLQNNNVSNEDEYLESQLYFSSKFTVGVIMKQSLELQTLNKISDSEKTIQFQTPTNTFNNIVTYDELQSKTVNSLYYRFDVDSNKIQDLSIFCSTMCNFIVSMIDEDKYESVLYLVIIDVLKFTNYDDLMIACLSAINVMFLTKNIFTNVTFTAARCALVVNENDGISLIELPFEDYVEDLRNSGKQYTLLSLVIDKNTREIYYYKQIGDVKDDEAIDELVDFTKNSATKIYDEIVLKAL